MKKSIHLFLFFWLLTCTAFAQQDSISTKYTNTPLMKAEVIMKDGNILRGGILAETDSTITIKSDIAGNLTIKRSNIVEVKYLDVTMPGNQQVYVNLASRYFFSPSGINMKKGDGYYQNIWFFFNSFNYAITDHISLGGGFEMFSLLAGKPIFFITPKVNFDITPNVHVGAGFMHFNYSLLANDPSSSGSLNLGFGSFTYGNADYNVTVNLGKDLGPNGGMVTTICGFAKVSPKFGFMTENWIFNASNDYTLYSFGGRVIGRKNLFDFGILTNSDIATSGILGIPYLSYTLRF